MSINQWIAIERKIMEEQQGITRANKKKNADGQFHFEFRVYRSISLPLEEMPRTHTRNAKYVVYLYMP